MTAAVDQGIRLVSAVAKQLLQPLDTVALRLIVESAHIRS